MKTGKLFKKITQISEQIKNNGFEPFRYIVDHRSAVQFRL